MEDNNQQDILADIRQAAEQSSSQTDLLEMIVKLLDGAFEHFTWTGFYLVDGEHLQVGPYVGAPTPHTRIKIGEGICGAAAESGQTIVVEDVNADTRYLACSIQTKSEIVVPLIDEGKILGEIDIDSNRISAFDSEDAKFLEQVAEIVVNKLRTF
ncbi:GAF domain-containing protein [bacterium AH-315-J21]|nr:GAF domain-containing protein [bacterium AH-315-J21]